MITINKEKQLSSIKELINNSNLMAIVNFIGMDSNSLTNVRRQLRNQGYTASVIKNKISAIALDHTNLLDKNEALKVIQGNSLFVFFQQDITIASKLLVDLNKQHKKHFQLKKLVDIEKKYFYDANSISQMALLPTKIEMLSQVSQALASPMSRLVEHIQSPLSSLVSSLKGMEERLN